jgi:hypothetical protein
MVVYKSVLNTVYWLARITADIWLYRRQLPYDFLKGEEIR